MPKTILLIGTLDTKGSEFAYVRDLIHKRGHKTLMVNVGVFESTISADISAGEVAQAGGYDLDELREKQDRGIAMQAMSQGIAKVVSKLHADGKFDGVLGLGGSGGTALATAGMRVLPIGVPKLMVSTVASGDISPYVDVKDITFMYSVVDIAGINRLSKQILANAVGMIVGAVEQEAVEDTDDKPLIAASMFGVTTPCVTHVQKILENAGYEVLIFHATGSGGRAMESLITDGFVSGVADVTTTEWCDELVGGVLSAGKDRLSAAGRAGIPQVVSVGALDMVNFWAIDTVPSEFKDRNLYKHNENVTLMRTSASENAQLGKIIAGKLNLAKGKTILLLPLKGVSMIDAEGQPFHDPIADKALFDAIRENIAPHIEVVELDLHINDVEFSQAIAENLLAMLHKGDD